MTLERLAYFAESRAGKVYRDVCERFGVDPARYIEAEDDVLAFNFRLGLALAHPPADPEDEPDADIKDAERKIAELRAELGGVP